LMNKRRLIKIRGVCTFISFIFGALVISGGIKTRPGQAFWPDVEPTLSQVEINSSASDTISQEVKNQIENLDPREKITVIISLAGPTSLDSAASSFTPSTSTNPVRHMQALAGRSQRNLLQYLGEMESAGLVQGITPFWIFNGIAVTASPQVIQEIGNRTDVIRIDPNRTFYAPDLSTLEASAPYNIEVIGAPALWEMGFRGQGVVVANMDTGVLGDHPDLAARWRGGANSWYDTTRQYPERPYDVDGHGTWTMGIIVGGDSSGQMLGVAPDAEWIAVRIFDDNDLATSIRVHQGFQWILDPDGNPDTKDSPHVVNSSWAFQATGCFLDFQADIRALRAAGILPIFAAGNAGPGDNTDLSPANNPGVFSVGAIDDRNLISISSSRGPSTCGQGEHIFPSLVAPGIGILSTSLGNGYAFSNGTSLAAPHVSGALALLLSAYPNLSVDEQERILLQSALDLGIDGPDNDYGHGKLDVLQAYRLLAGQPVPPAQPWTPIGQNNGKLLYLPTLFGISRD
jgi:subtilisin family serine protease